MRPDVTVTIAKFKVRPLRTENDSQAGNFTVPRSGLIPTRSRETEPNWSDPSTFLFFIFNGWFPMNVIEDTLRRCGMDKDRAANELLRFAPR